MKLGGQLSGLDSQQLSKKNDHPTTGRCVTLGDPVKLPKCNYANDDDKDNNINMTTCNQQHEQPLGHATSGHTMM